MDGLGDVNRASLFLCGFGNNVYICNYRPGSDIDLAVVGNNIDFRLILKISCEIEDLELLYGVDLLDYQAKKGTPIGEHIDRVGQVFYSCDE